MERGEDSLSKTQMDKSYEWMVDFSSPSMQHSDMPTLELRKEMSLQCQDGLLGCLEDSLFSKDVYKKCDSHCQKPKWLNFFLFHFSFWSKPVGYQIGLNDVSTNMFNCKEKWTKKLWPAKKTKEKSSIHMDKHLCNVVMNELYKPNHSLNPWQSMWSTEACVMAFTGS